MFSAKDLWNLKSLGAPKPSPCGTMIAYEVKWTPEGSPRGFSQICLYDLKKEKQIALTSGDHNDSQPVWSADSTRLFFLSDRHEKKKQFFEISISGGEARRLTSVDFKISDPRYTCFEGQECLIFVGEMGSEPESDTENQSSARITENRMFRFWDKWLTDGKYPHFFKLELSSGELTQLTEGTQRYLTMMDYGGSFSVWQNKLAFSANVTPEPYHEIRNALFEIDLKSGETSCLLDDEGYSYMYPQYSPEGQLYFSRYLTPADYADHPEIFEYHKEDLRLLDHGLDRQVMGYVLSPTALLFSTDSEQRSPIFLIDRKTAEVRTYRADSSFSAVQTLGEDQLVCLSCSARHPHRIEISDLASGEVKLVIDPNAEQLKSFKMGDVELMNFAGGRGDQVGMTVVYPPDFDPTKKWPLLQMIHGGPHSCFGDIWHGRWNAQVFAQQGYVVACVNYHGSTGFGEKFAKDIKGHAATLPHEDIMLATDFLISKGYIDENRMAASGGSYGGYMTSWLAGHTDRFKALINHSGVFNAQAQYASDVTYGRNRMFGGSPWEGLENLDAQNPSRFASEFKTPMLVLHGEKDYRVPVTQGIEAYTVYKSMGLEARFVHFPDENHWILKRANSELWYREFLGWLERYLG